MRLMFGLCMLGVLVLGGCNSYDLRYQAIPQPNHAHLYADYTALQDFITFSIDTDGRRLEDCYVKKADGTVVRPYSIAGAGYYQSASLGTGVGGFGDHVGGGVGLGFPVGPKQAHGLTVAAFAVGPVGPPPWALHVKVQGVDEAIIPGVGGNPTTK